MLTPLRSHCTTRSVARATRRPGAPMPDTAEAAIATADQDPAPVAGEALLDENAGVAEALAQLSLSGEPPEGHGPAGAGLPAFEASTVDFNNGDWLQKVTSVQGWLCLDSAIEHNATPLQALRVLFYQAAPGKKLSALASVAPFPALTEIGRQRLETFLSKAVDLRTVFEEELEEVGRSAAARSWREKWEEWGAQSKRQPGKITAQVDTWKIKDFRGYAEEGGLDLNPSFQRGDVWSKSESQLLVESILLGIPLPSIILTKERQDDVWQIVDGKQRLTAILRFIGRHPVACDFARAHGGDAGFKLFDESFKKFVKKHGVKGSDHDEHYLPFPLPKYEADHPLAHLSQKYYCEIKDKTIAIGDQKIKVEKLFEKEDAKYKIPVILYENTQIQDIHHVFGLYNKQGRKLNAEELRNAVYHHLYLTRLLLFLGGDRSDEPTRKKLAPCLPDEELVDRARKVGKFLEEKGIGIARFKRTKVLAWAVAILAQAPNKNDGVYTTPSTAKQIDSLLDAIMEQTTEHALYQEANLKGLTELICDATELHRAADGAWHPKFKSKGSFDSKWDELPFVASLVASVLLVLSGAKALSDEQIDKARAFTETRKGPKKSQNRTQWGFIASVAIGMLEHLSIDLKPLAAALESAMGSSCLDVLQALQQDYDKSEH
ncbi:MAG: DUF262 domain-containing protein [Myxococcales bacterium]